MSPSTVAQYFNDWATQVIYWAKCRPVTNVKKTLLRSIADH